MTKGLSYKEMVEFFDGRFDKFETNVGDRFDKFDEKIDGIQTRLNNQKLLSSVIGGAAGVIAAILNPFKTKL